MPFAATWMDLEIIILSKPERQIMILLTCGILKIDTPTKQKHREQTCGFQGGRGQGREVLGIGH